MSLCQRLCLQEATFVDPVTGEKVKLSKDRVLPPDSGPPRAMFHPVRLIAVDRYLQLLLQEFRETPDDIIAELKRLKVENEKLEAEGREEESVRRQLDALGNERKYGNKQLSERRRTDALYKGQLAEKEKELRELQAPSPVPPTLPIGG